MAKQTIFKLEHGDIEFNDDGETKVYTYKGKPFSELSENEIAEIRESPEMQEFVKTFALLADVIARIFEQVKAAILPVMNEAMAKIKAVEAEAEKAKKKKPAKKPAAKKVKSDEKK